MLNLYDLATGDQLMFGVHISLQSKNQNFNKEMSSSVKTFTSVSTQTEVIQRDFVSARILSSFYRESEAFPSIFYKSRTITQMMILISVLFVLAILLESDTMAASAKKGFFMACTSMLVFSMIYFPNTLIQRPHPAVWRLLQGWGCCYLMSVVFALFFSYDQLQEFLTTFIDPTLGKPLEEKSYASDCRLFTPEHPHSKMANISGAMDMFVIAHLGGWMIKMFALRDFQLAMIQQMMFELMEITFRHWLPNFYECWWDHIILDIILCNTGGILVAYYLMKRFGMREYKWSLRKTEPKQTFFQNLKGLLLTPNLEHHEWQVFSSTKRFLAVLWFIIFMNLIDLSYFFNKYILWIEPNHNIWKLRVFGLGFLCIAAAREYFVYITDSNVKRLGPSAWLVFMIILVEWLLFAKNYKGTFQNAFPTYVICIWSIIAVVFCSILATLIYRDIKKSRAKKLD